MADETKSEVAVLSPVAVMPLGKVRARLTRVWLLWSALIVTLVLAQSVLHKYDQAVPPADDAAVAAGADAGGSRDLTVDVWKWLLPNLLPTLTTMVAAVAANAFLQREDVFVRRDFYHSAMGLSVFYLAVLTGLLLSQPIANPRSAVEQVKSLQTSNIATGPVQGLVASALGVLFSTGKPAKAKEDGEPGSAVPAG